MDDNIGNLVYPSMCNTSQMTTHSATLRESKLLPPIITTRLIFKPWTFTALGRHRIVWVWVGVVCWCVVCCVLCVVCCLLWCVVVVVYCCVWLCVVVLLCVVVVVCCGCCVLWLLCVVVVVCCVLLCVVWLLCGCCVFVVWLWLWLLWLLWLLLFGTQLGDRVRSHDIGNAMSPRTDLRVAGHLRVRLPATPPIRGCLTSANSTSASWPKSNWPKSKRWCLLCFVALSLFLSFSFFFLFVFVFLFSFSFSSSSYSSHSSFCFCSVSVFVPKNLNPEP